MNSKVKILAMYLPQYHEIAENSRFWGKGFTDWVSVKKAIPLFKNHKQPHVPLNNNYYDLSQKDSIDWQIKLAKKYRVYGFGIYHYWFSTDRQLLTKPAEILLENKDLDMPFYFAWDNASWRRTWSKFRGNAWAPLEDAVKKSQERGPSVLVEYKLGDESDWKVHFNYLLKFFQDERYIKVNGKPLFEVFNYSEDIYRMQDYWNLLAKENGFDGIEFLYKNSVLYKLPCDCTNFCYEPQNSGWGSTLNTWFYKALCLLGIAEKFGPYKYSYDKIWNQIIENAKHRTKANEWHGAFVAYDDTPRRGRQGRVVVGSTPEKFEKYLGELVSICEQQGKEFILLTAWNEWGEGAALEPSQADKFAYLNAISNMVKKHE